jgi:hypothetical protein
MQGNFYSFVMPSGTSQPGVCATPLAAPIITIHKPKTDLRDMVASFAEAGPTSRTAG